MTPQQLAEMEALCEKATPHVFAILLDETVCGPGKQQWEIWDECNITVAITFNGGVEGTAEANAKFYAASREFIPAAIARIRELEQANKHLAGMMEVMARAAERSEGDYE